MKNTRTEKEKKNEAHTGAVFFANQDMFRKWLEINHDKESELIVGFYKVDSGRASLTWSQSVDQALCFGWIDGIRKSIDKISYCIRFTPRKKTSIWSAINIAKVEELKRAGLMKPEGLKAFGFRAENKSKIYSHEKEEIELSSDYEKQFRKNKVAYAFFIKQAPSYRKVIINWIMSAKQEKTRQSRLNQTIVAGMQLKRLNQR